VILDSANNKILIYPYKFENPEETETFTLSIEARTLGEVTSMMNITITLLGLK
jgi:hypothetical protein